MRLVVDASIAVEWVLQTPGGGNGALRAIELLRAARQGLLQIVQPPHWLIEVAAVVARLRPEGVIEGIDLLDALQFEVAFDVDILKRASRMSVKTQQHLFDSLYHAVALEREAVLLTADERYLRQARSFGNILSLAEWRPPAGTEG